MFEHAMKYKECPMRNRGYNCDPVGGDCATGISDELCEAIHAAYNKGFRDCADQMLKNEAGEIEISKPKYFDINQWLRKMLNMPIEIPQKYIDGWNAGRLHEPYDDTQSTVWKCGYDDGRYNLPGSLL